MRAKLGQHFLVDSGVLHFEAKQAGVQGKKVLEIGAGDGRLTSELLAAGAAHITAVELDRRLAAQLASKFHRRVSVLRSDILKLDESRRFNVVVGNIPYYLTSPILLKLGRMAFDSALLCLQKEVAERMTALPGTSNYGRLSAVCQLMFEIELVAYVPREAFAPIPNVDSCIIRLKKRGFLLDPRTESVIGALFSHRRKSVKNAAKDARMALFGKKDKRHAEAIAQTLKYSGKKVFSLSPSQVLEVARQLV